MKKIMDGTNNRIGKIVLAVVNICLIATAILSLFLYSVYIRKGQRKSNIDAFCSTIESMKLISWNYLKTEEGYVKDWAGYIQSRNMDMEEALDYIKNANSNKDRYAHIVDMDTYDAYSTYNEDGGTLDYYRKLVNSDDDTASIFLNNMKQMYSGAGDEFNVLGKYTMQETQISVVSVGTRVMLDMGDGTSKPYLLLRLIPVNSIKSIWIFPVEYTAAEVGIITKSGSYVIQSNAMKSQNFTEFIRGYNFENDYNRVEDLKKQLASTDKGLLEYNNSKGQDSYWYYSEFGGDSGLYILGYTPVSSLARSNSNIVVILIICTIIVALVIIDGIYIWRMNRRLRITAQFAEQANAAKTRFLSSMSHDIRTPMNAIIGMTDIAQKNIDDPERVRDCLKKITTAGNHLITLVNDILDISKVESGNMFINSDVFSIDDVMDKIINIIQPQIDSKNITFSVNAGPFEYKWLMGDELRLNQIFINILTNAVKYTPAGGTIELSMLEERNYDGRVCLTYRVADSGIGMSEEFQKNMYNSFARAMDSRIDKINGSGLGLAIVKQLVDLMGGSIECESEEGRGTTFTVKLMLYLADVNEESIQRTMEDVSPKEIDEDFRDVRVLVAEDNDINWEILEELLAEHGVKCDRAVNGRECVDMITAAERGKYVMILMDVQMPVMNGKDAAREIRRSSDGYVRSIPIYAITADAFADDVKECFEAGMDGHIAKPIDFNKVKEALRDAIYRKWRLE